jgi:hypothetical protein
MEVARKYSTFPFTKPELQNHLLAQRAQTACALTKSNQLMVPSNRGLRTLRNPYNRVGNTHPVLRVSEQSKPVTSVHILSFWFMVPCRRNVALGSTQPLTEISTRNLFRAKGRPAR